MADQYYFGEKEYEYDSISKTELPVWQSPKYMESKKKAIEMIKAEMYNLSTADFWILMNKTKTGKMAYTGLIISHNGCLKINDAIDNKVDPKCFHLDKDGYKNSLVYIYCDADTYEVGEFNSENCKNSYPYAMAFKRCFDRVVLKKSKLAYSGIYSEAEAEEFKDNEQQNLEKLELMTKLTELVEQTNTDYEKLLGFYKVTSNGEMTVKQLREAIETLEKRVK